MCRHTRRSSRKRHFLALLDKLFPAHAFFTKGAHARLAPRYNFRADLYLQDVSRDNVAFALGNCGFCIQRYVGSICREPCIEV